MPSGQVSRTEADRIAFFGFFDTPRNKLVFPIESEVSRIWTKMVQIWPKLRSGPFWPRFMWRRCYL